MRHHSGSGPAVIDVRLEADLTPGWHRVSLQSVDTEGPNAPANEAPKHHAARLMLMTRPRRRAGQVSATSIEPSDHSPFSSWARFA